MKIGSIRTTIVVASLIIVVAVLVFEFSLPQILSPKAFETFNESELNRFICSAWRAI